MLIRSPDVRFRGPETKTSYPSLIPLQNLGTTLYRGAADAEGGLYAGGTNTIPAGHSTTMTTAGGNVTKRLANGTPDAAGKIGVAIMGYSNIQQIGDYFMTTTLPGYAGLASGVTFANLAHGGYTAEVIGDPAGSSYAQFWNTDLPADLSRDGLTRQQVQVVWLQQRFGYEGTIDPWPGSIDQLLALVKHIVERIDSAGYANQFTNLEQIFVSNCEYSYYNVQPGNAITEPRAYEEQWAFRKLIGQQIAVPTTAPMDWGPLIWCNGMQYVLDVQSGVVHNRTPSDLRFDDGLHPMVPQGRIKGANQLLEFFKKSPFTAWFRA